MWINEKLRVYFSTPNQSTIQVAELASVLENVLSCIPLSLVKGTTADQALVTEIRVLLQGILSLDIQDVSIVAHQLPMLASFSPFMDIFPDLLLSCIEKVCFSFHICFNA